MSAAIGKRKRSVSQYKTLAKKMTTLEPNPTPVRIKIPANKSFTGPPGCFVFVADDGEIYDASLNRTDTTQNINKCYHMQLLEAPNGEYWLQCRYGRNGGRIYSKTEGGFSLDHAKSIFFVQFSKRTGLPWHGRCGTPIDKKYVFYQKSYEIECEEEVHAHHSAPRDGNIDGVHGLDTQATPILPPQTKKLMGLIFNETYLNDALDKIGFDLQQMPSGRLDGAMVELGYLYLGELSNLLRAYHPDLWRVGCPCPRCAGQRDLTGMQMTDDGTMCQHARIVQLTNQYYSAIPHVSARHAPPVFQNERMIQKELRILDRLRELAAADKIMRSTKNLSIDVLANSRFEQLKTNMTPLSHSSNEFSALKDYLVNTSAESHRLSYEVQDIFRIERNDEVDRFNKWEHWGFSSTSRRLLWHGSRTTNFAGILSQGLRIAPPEAPVNGYAFGKGVYFADMSSKSANYCKHAESEDSALLLLAEVELGHRMYALPWGFVGAAEQCEKEGCIATIGVGRYNPGGWVDAGHIHPSLRGVIMPDTSVQFEHNNDSTSRPLRYNEYIVYDEAQVKLRYLVYTLISVN